MKIKKLSWIYIVGFAAMLNACGTRDANDTGSEFAPQMYVSKAYEPFTQVEGDKNKINPDGANMRTPPAKTIARRRFNINFEGNDSTGNFRRDIMSYAIHKDSIMVAERLLKNPFKVTPKVLEDGQVLYTRFCAHCHGESGDGNGLVNKMYKGVANISASGALKNMNDGHIYHVITHGKGRMWPHATLVNPDERWKIVAYVHKLQGQIDDKGMPVATAKEEKKEAKDGEKKAEKPEAKAPEKK